MSLAGQRQYLTNNWEPLFNVFMFSFFFFLSHFVCVRCERCKQLFSYTHSLWHQLSPKMSFFVCCILNKRRVHTHMQNLIHRCAHPLANRIYYVLCAKNSVEFTSLNERKGSNMHIYEYKRTTCMQRQVIFKNIISALPVCIMKRYLSMHIYIFCCRNAPQCAHSFRIQFTIKRVPSDQISHSFPQYMFIFLFIRLLYDNRQSKLIYNKA